MDTLRVMIVGGGGREHALAWAAKRSPRVGQLWIAPGNAGTASLGENVALAADDVFGITRFAAQNHIDLVIVGPEVPLALGLVDQLKAAGIKAFGPSAQAAQLEASKAFSKAFMQEVGIPTARAGIFRDFDAAAAYLDTVDYAVVVKADGLAAGKGVIVCDDHAQALEALHHMLQDEAFGGAGGTVIIEERLTGKEVSVLAFSDGQRCVLMPPTRDHKRAFEGDQGPNTGGMGAFTHPDDVSPALLAQIHETVLKPAVQGMAARGIPFVGVLYAGVLLAADGIQTLEFNARFGDPETQAILPLLESDLIEIMLACISGTLDESLVRWRDAYGATVVAAAGGYPGKYQRGTPIYGLDASDDALVFHAGTEMHGDQIVTAGGRVLAVSAVGSTRESALECAYARLEGIRFEGMHYRRDIGRVL